MHDAELQKQMPRSARTLIAIAGIAIDPSNISTPRDREKAAAWERLKEEMRPNMTREDVRAFAPKRQVAGKTTVSRNDEEIIIGIRIPAELAGFVVDEELAIASKFVFDHEGVALLQMQIRRETRSLRVAIGHIPSRHNPSK